MSFSVALSQCKGTTRAFAPLPTSLRILIQGEVLSVSTSFRLILLISLTPGSRNRC